MAISEHRTSRRSVLGALAIIPAIAALPANATTPDDAAAVRAHGDEYRRLYAEFVAYHDGVFLPMDASDPRLAAAYERQQAMETAATHKLFEIEAYPVTTFAGLNAKLDALIAAYGGDDDDLEGCGLIDTLIADIRRIGGEA